METIKEFEAIKARGPGRGRGRGRGPGRGGRGNINTQTQKENKSNSSLAAKSQSRPVRKIKSLQVVPTSFAETKVLPSVALSLSDKARELVLSDDQLTCYGAEGGYRMARATHGADNGSYYWEVEILETSAKDSHIRVGWSTRNGELQAPVGYDQYSFGYRDIDGSKIHKSNRLDYYGEPYGPGDIIGCHLILHHIPGSNKIEFFKNGKSQGIAFSGEEIPLGIYFPSVSIFMNGNVRVNFGPSFIIPPGIPANAISELQPMNPIDRKDHERKIASIRQAREEKLAAQNIPNETISESSNNS